jgi:hypothetical protein
MRDFWSEEPESELVRRKGVESMKVVEVIDRIQGTEKNSGRGTWIKLDGRRSRVLKKRWQCCGGHCRSHD